jgi:hypothetical protein
MAWHVTYQEIRPYVVRIETINGIGTGFLFAYNRDHSIAAIATASHVIDTAVNWQQPIKVWHPNSDKTLYLEKKDRATLLNPDRDAAAVILPAGSFKFPEKALPLQDPTKIRKIGVGVGWVGFPALALTKLCFFSGPISGHIQDVYLIDGVAINGVSGGPVFAEEENNTVMVIGVVSAYIPNRRVGESLPGLLQAQDLSAFHDYIKRITDLDEAKEKEAEAQKKIERAKQAPQTGPDPAPLGTPSATSRAT